MKKLLLLALLALIPVSSDAQVACFGPSCPAGGSGVPSNIPSGTPTDCTALSVWRTSAGQLLECGLGLTYSNGVISAGTASSLRGGFDLFGATHAFKSRFQVSESQSADATYTFPVNDGGASEVLKTDGSGVLSWASPLAGLIEPKAAVILAPSGAIDVIVWRATHACTVTKIQAYTVGGTSANVNAMKNSSDLLAADLTATAGGWVSTSTIQNASFAVDDTLTIQIISLSGSPTAVTIQVECTR